MEKQSFVSVILATYNRKDQLRECLDSLLGQNYPVAEYEVIVVNDGSTDGTEAFLEDYSKRNSILRFFSQTNSGPAVARNLGIEKSRGDIICFTDDDCIADKYWIYNLVTLFTGERIGGVGGKLIQYTSKTLTEKYGNRFDQKKRSKEYLLAGNAAYMRDVLELVGGFDGNLRSFEDLDLGIRVKAKGYELLYTDNAIVTHRDYDTLMWLIKRQYGLGKTFVRMSQKYSHNFSKKYYLCKWILTLTETMILLPTSVIRRNKKDYFLYNLFTCIILSSNLTGLLIGSFTEKYPGAQFTEKLPFMEEESMENLVRSVLRKIRLP
jgi:glycosyltransferase involved in cell wall biosynthesis